MTDQQTDTPVSQPPSPLDGLKSFIGDLARPFAIIVTSAATAFAIVQLASQAKDLSAAAIFVGALFAGLGALSAAKTYENVKQAQASADVAKSTGGGQ